MKAALALAGPVLFIVLLGCATSPAERLDLDADLRIFQESDLASDAREWRIQRRFATDGPLMPLGEPVFSVDIVAFLHGTKHPRTAGASGFLLRLHARDWGWHFLHDREVTLWLNGEDSIPLGEGEYVDAGRFAYRGLGNFHTETLVVPLWRSDLDRLAKSRFTQVNAGGTRFTLHHATLDAITRLLAIVPDSVK